MNYNKTIAIAVIVILLCLSSQVGALPFENSSLISIGGSRINVSDYQIKINTSYSTVVFTDAETEEPHYNNVFQACRLHGDNITIWVKIPEIPTTGTKIKMWYNPRYKIGVVNDCQKVFLWYEEFQTANITYMFTRRWAGEDITGGLFQ